MEREPVSFAVQDNCTKPERRDRMLICYIAQFSVGCSALSIVTSLNGPEASIFNPHCSRIADSKDGATTVGGPPGGGNANSSLRSYRPLSPVWSVTIVPNRLRDCGSDSISATLNIVTP